MNDTFTKLSEIVNGYWESFLQAVPRIALAILIIAIGVMIANWISGFSRRRLLNETKDPLMGRFLAEAIKVILVICVILLGLHTAGLSSIAGGLLATAGASAVVLGFAFKDIAENFLAGIILSFSRPFHVNDTISVGDTFGKIKALNFRYTHIKTFDGRDTYIPNSDVLTDPVINYTADGYFRWDFIVGIAYEDDIDGAKNVIQNILDKDPEIVHDELHENFVIENELAASTVNLKVFFWVETKDFRHIALITKGKLIRKVKQALEKDGYSMPADIREIKLYGREKDFPVRMRTENGQQKEEVV